MDYEISYCNIIVKCLHMYLVGRSRANSGNCWTPISPITVWVVISPTDIRSADVGSCCKVQ